MSGSAWILGYAARKWTAAEGVWYDTHIGGEAIWPDDLQVSVPECPICESTRKLVLQAYAPHQSHADREIYIFGCNSIRCSAEESSWYALRVCKETSNKPSPATHYQEPDESPLLEQVELGSKEIDWDNSSDGSSTDSEDLSAKLSLLSLELQYTKVKEETVQNSSKASTLSYNKLHNGPSQPHKTLQCDTRESQKGDAIISHSHSVQHLGSYYIEVAEEPKQAKILVQESDVNRLLEQYKEEESRHAHDSTEVWSAEMDDETLATHSFDLFQERIARAPRQVLRYKLGGEALWPKYPAPHVNSDLLCSCGSTMVFELQLLGSCLHYLQPDKALEPQQKESGMNFASVVIFTCKADCTKSKILAESHPFKVFSQVVCVQQDDW